MAHLLLHHKVKDFTPWKVVYDQHAAARAEAGLTELHLLRGISDANDIVILFQLEDLEKARVFLGSADLHATMQRSGVVGETQLIELE